MKQNLVSKLLDMQMPEVHKANWNLDHDIITTMDVGYIVPMFVDEILANTNVDFDLYSAVFANPTVAPLYGRYKLQFTAWFAPTALYVSPLRDGDAVDADTDFVFPFISPDWKTENNKIFSWFNQSNAGTNPNNFNYITLFDSSYVPHCSLLEYLGAYPAGWTAGTWVNPLNGPNQELNDNPIDDTAIDVPPRRNGIPFLMYWDIYRNYFLNVQEPIFPVRTRAFHREYTANGNILYAQPPGDTYVDRERVNEFFRNIRRNYTAEDGVDVRQTWETLGLPPIFPKRNVVNLTGSNYFPDAEITPDDYIFFEDYHYGLARTTYMPDMYTAWISNTNVELERSKAKVVVENNEFTMEQWKTASRIQNFVRKTIFKNSDFAEFIDVHYGVKPPTNLTKPMFLGAISQDVAFNDVVSTATTSEDTSVDANSQLGSRAGYGRGRRARGEDNGGFVRFHAKEPGYFMVLATLVPEVFYYEASEPFYSKLALSEYFYPEYNAIGYQDLPVSDLNEVPYSDDLKTLPSLNIDFQQWNDTLAQQPAWMEYMTRQNRLHGQMAEPGVYRPWSLSRSFNYSNQRGYTLPQSVAYSSYVLPEMFNNIFVNQQNIDNFQLYIGFDYKKYQPVLKQFLSFNS